MRAIPHIRGHVRDVAWRHSLESALWNAGFITLAVLTIAILFFGILAVRAN